MFQQYLYWSLKSFRFKHFHYFSNTYEIMLSRHRTDDSISNTPSKKWWERTTPWIKLNLLKIKHLLNQMQIQVKLQNTVHCKSKNLLFWDFQRTRKKSLYKNATTILWSFLIRANSIWKWTFTTITTTRNRSCKSIITTTWNRASSIVTKTASIWQWNSRC